MIKISYRAVDGFRKTSKFKTLEGARTYAHKAIGEHPDMGSDYAVSFDGIATIRCEGCTLAELFPGADEIEAEITRRMNEHNAAEAAAEEADLQDYWNEMPPAGSALWEM